MRTFRLTSTSMLLVAAISLTEGGSTASAAPGPQIAIHPHVGTHVYSHPFHHIRGRVGITNYSTHVVTIQCKVVVTLEGDGDTHKKGSDMAKARVDAGTTRKPHYAIDIKDSDHHLKNVPTHIVAHCDQV